MGIYCNLKHLGDPENEYVCWLDIMGTKNNMLDSVKGSANFILKLHATILENHEQYCGYMKLYPIMDGVYITTKSCNDLQRFLASVFYSLSIEFIETKKTFHKFFVKASVAYGPVYHGENIPDDVNKKYSSYPAYRSSMLFGAPMVLSYEGEKKAPPFGVYIHESARALVNTNENTHFTTSFWKWHYNNAIWKRNDEKDEKQEKYNHLSKFRTAYRQQYNWLRKKSHELDYKLDRIDLHSEMMEQYFKFNDIDEEGLISEESAQ